LTEAKRGAQRLLGCFRTGDANDPETYISAVVAVLERYPVDVIHAVTQPAGLPSQYNWLPTIKEVRSACEEIEGPRRRAMEWEALAAKQITERRQLVAIADKRRPTYDELMQRCADAGLPIGKAKQKISPVEVMQRHGISQAQWDAIPEARR
jgi:hypothetical protein